MIVNVLIRDCFEQIKRVFNQSMYRNGVTCLNHLINLYFLLNNELISVVSRSWGAVKLLSDVPKTPIYRGQSLPLNFISYSYNMLIIWAFDHTWDIKSRNDTIESLEWSLMRYTWFESGILLSPYHVTPGSLITQYTTIPDIPLLDRFPQNTR